jgi:methyl-accepting chemotaxis protein PixJ
MIQQPSGQNPKKSKENSTSTTKTQEIKQFPKIAKGSQSPFAKSLSQKARGSQVNWQADWQNSSTPFHKQPMQWWRERRLRFKVMTLAVTLATLPVMGVGGAAYYFANQTFTQRVVAESEDYSLSVQNKINLFLRQRLGDIQVMSQLSIFVDPTQRTEISIRQKQDVLDRYVEAYGAYDSIAVTDIKGNVLVQSIGEPLPNLSDRMYFQQALKADQPIISQPEAGTVTKVLSIYVVAPIRDSRTGKTIGFIQARIPGDSFRMAVLSEEVQHKSIKIYLVDGNGKLFVTPEGVGAAAVDAQGSPILNANGKIQGIDVRSVYPSYKKLSSQDQPVVDLASQELVTLTPIEDLRDLPSLGWKLLITENRAGAFAAQSQLLLTLQVGTGLAILLAGGIAALIANRAIIPILAATNAVTKIGQGKLDARLNVQGRDEIAILGTNINQMATQLQQSLKARAFEADQERILTNAKGSGTLRQSGLNVVFDQAVAAVHSLLRLDRVVIYRFDGAGVVAESVSQGYPSAFEQQVSDACIPGQVQEAYCNGYTAVLHNLSKARLHPEHLELLERLMVQSSLVVPMVGGDRLFGLLIAHSCSASRYWEELEIEFFKRLGTELGLTAYRVTLLEETEKLAEEQRQLKEGLQRRALELLQEVEPIGKGNLTIRARVTADEIGTIADSYNATVDNLRKLVLQVKVVVNQVVATTHANDASIQALSVEASRQVEAITTALERVEEVVEAVRAVSTNAKQAEMVMQQAAQMVEIGDAAIDRIVVGNEMIRETVAVTAEKVEHLTSSSRQISAVVSLISNFAAQTRMLAFNVSIEANRAGEEGRVIHTIAHEVHALVQQSEDAAKEIRELAAGIQAETNQVATAMASNIQQVTSGTQLIDETRHSLNEVTNAGLQINQLVQAITQATIVQQQASETIAQTMTNVAEISQKTSTETERVSISFEQLRQVAQLLEAGIDQFKVS